VSFLRERLAACDEAVRAHLDPGEEVLAVGRCEDVTEHGSLERGGGWTFVMVTNTRLRWVPHADLRFESALRLDDITAVTERSAGHRYAIALDHGSLTRAHHAPAHRFLWFAWGNAIASSAMTRTELAFSRRDTAAAQALRDQASSRELM
jgi:hypothetical protein